MTPWEDNLNPITMLPAYTKTVTKEQRRHWNDLRNKRRKALEASNSTIKEFN